MKRYRPWNPDQSFLFPPSPHDWLPEGHLAYFLLDVVSELDLSAVVRRIQERDHRGERPYDPGMMTALLLYAYCVGVYSSRRIERATYEDVAFRVVSGGQHPHFTSINTFRRQHLESLKGLFLQVLQLCQGAEMVKLGVVALDGTKVQGNASKHKAMSYERMVKKESQLRAEIAELLSRAEAEDAAEDARFGEGQQEEDLPAELRRREGRLKRIQQVKERLEREAAEARARALRVKAAGNEARAEEESNETEQKRTRTRAKQQLNKARELSSRDDDDVEPPRTEDGLPKHEPPATTEGKPTEKAQLGFTDPDSRLMESGGSFLQGYNCQAVVDDAHQVIVAKAVSNKSPDSGNFSPMIEKTRVNCGAYPDKALGDAGYWMPGVTTDLPDVDVYIATERKVRGRSDSGEEAPPPSSRCDDERTAMRTKLKSEEGRAVYSRRKAVVEPVFGQIKEARGFRRFLLRGLTSVQGEWSLICTAHNLLKLYRFQGAPALV
jgi:transposase